MNYIVSFNNSVYNFSNKKEAMLFAMDSKIESIIVETEYGVILYEC